MSLEVFDPDLPADPDRQPIVLSPEEEQAIAKERLSPELEQRRLAAAFAKKIEERNAGGEIRGIKSKRIEEGGEEERKAA
jgi:hypothetical protein